MKAAQPEKTVLPGNSDEIPKRKKRERRREQQHTFVKEGQKTAIGGREGLALSVGEGGVVVAVAAAGAPHTSKRKGKHLLLTTTKRRRRQLRLRERSPRRDRQTAGDTFEESSSKKSLVAR
uniref:Uncharacterized protein n=1 Tax=Ditylenchus dipsaci TaxID=166011 RepID=A0A915EK21_9BILA